MAGPALASILVLPSMLTIYARYSERRVHEREAEPMALRGASEPQAGAEPGRGTQRRFGLRRPR